MSFALKNLENDIRFCCCYYRFCERCEDELYFVTILASILEQSTTRQTNKTFSCHSVSFMTEKNTNIKDARSLENENKLKIIFQNLL